ncbi:apolipoprotein N-acyltransferase [Schaalia sp. ZJ405]|uniref:apolipoprotein N-acyltransferase n=1 Tax=Schaalia sp. ZJ405 TaxID=2709403 RepID=UPI0013ED181C|nr:apolipoprotein N-acyltransferase [Schaalia sp. ZJ405]QPK82106.1 apolipoprotein N-acyltransferase [Schaalia sp. ZJ405]
MVASVKKSSSERLAAAKSGAKPRNEDEAARGYLLVDLLCGILGGVALWTTFPDLSWWWMSVPAMALLAVRVSAASTGRAMLIAGVFALAFWLPLISWIQLPVDSVGPWLVLSVFEALFIIAWAWIVKVSATVWQWARTPLGEALIYTLVWVGTEQLRSRFPWTGFPWGNIAMPQVDSPLGNLAPYGGESLVSGAIMFVAVMLARAFSLHRCHDVTSWWGRPAMLATAAAVFILPLAIPLPADQEAGSLRLAAIQGGVDYPGITSFGVEGQVSENHLRETTQLAKSPAPQGAPGQSQSPRSSSSASDFSADLILWGETAADRDPRVSAIVRQNVDEASHSVGVPILLGFQNFVNEGRFNWLGVWYPDSGLDEASLYAKQKPVPFGEFIPFRSFVSRLASQAAQVEVDMLPGKSPGYLVAKLNDGREVPLAVGICFESAYESAIGEGVALGGQLIVVPSNNVDFRSTAQTAQQAQQVRFRAIEFGRSAVQISTTGRSLIARPNGSVITASEPESSATLLAQVALRSTKTPATTLAPILATGTIVATGVLALVSLGGLIAARWTSRRR